jgi:hypothetical protein
MRGAIPPLSQYAFMAWCSVKKKLRDNFTFYLFINLLGLRETQLSNNGRLKISAPIPWCVCRQLHVIASRYPAFVYSPLSATQHRSVGRSVILHWEAVQMCSVCICVILMMQLVLND